MRRLSVLAMPLLGILLLAGCGAHRMTPVDARPVGDLKAEVEDADGGHVGLAPDFKPAAYRVIVLQPFEVSASEIKDQDDARLAKDMAAYLHAQLLRRLQATGIFVRVVDASISALPPSDERAIRLQGQISKLTEGSQALRYFVGFGAGAAKAQIETRLVDPQSQRVVMITADRRAAGMGIFGGDGRQFVTESMDQMADGYVKLLKHLWAGGRPGAR